MSFTTELQNENTRLSERVSALESLINRFLDKVDPDDAQNYCYDGQNLHEEARRLMGRPTHLTGYKEFTVSFDVDEQMQADFDPDDTVSYRIVVYAVNPDGSEVELHDGEPDSVG